ncbi:MAG: DUF3034 family protein [Acidobacteriota bacterium]|nr:DUF3034 family protein [Acidobacteriota bacterium]
MPRLFVLLTALLAASQLHAQNLTLEGQTGGFLTPTAYVVPAREGHFLSHLVVGYHFVNSNNVIGDIHTFSILEGFANRAEAGYTRSVHVTGDSAMFSGLWHYAGMNVFNGKVVALKEGTGPQWVPGIAAGFVIRTGDHFVSGALNKKLYGVDKSYTNEDIYVAATKTWLKPPVPFLVNLGWKATNASIYGIGGQATRFGGRLFGGLGIPVPGPWKSAIVPSVGFTQEPPQVKNLGAILAGGKAHIPTTLDYAVRVMQRDHSHYSFDIGVGQVAGQIGTTYVNPPGTSVLVPVPVNLEARKVLGLGFSYRY